MTRYSLLFLYSPILILASCVDKADPKYRECVRHKEGDNVAAAMSACLDAIEASPDSESGKKASALLGKLKEKQEQARKAEEEARQKKEKEEQEASAKKAQEERAAAAASAQAAETAAKEKDRLECLDFDVAVLIPQEFHQTKDFAIDDWSRQVEYETPTKASIEITKGCFFPGVPSIDWFWNKATGGPPLPLMTVDLKLRGTDWFNVSGYLGKGIYYRRMKAKGRRYGSFLIMYDKRERDTYDGLLDAMQNSLVIKERL